jgi:hypothetical protein
MEGGIEYRDYLTTDIADIFGPRYNCETGYCGEEIILADTDMSDAESWEWVSSVIRNYGNKIRVYKRAT